MAQSADRPMDFADATLVHVAARERLSLMLTVDHDDFETYRLPGRKKFAILPSRTRS
jgi:predicted nucleic acid-binding protein